MNEILGAAGWQEDGWTPVEFIRSEGPPVELAQPIPNGEPFNAQVALNSFRRMQRKSPGKVAVASRLAADRASESLSAYLRGGNETNLQRSIKLTAFFGEKARLTLRVKSVASDAVMVVRVDGAEVLRTNFVGAGAAHTKPQEINQDFAFDLPPGKRVIEIANDAGADWILLDSLKLEQMRPAEFPGDWAFAPEPVGLRNGKKAVLYVDSPLVVFPAGALRYNPPLLSHQSLKLADWPAGTFNARWFDPCTGREVGTTEATTEGNILTLPLPAFRDDLAAIVTLQR
jgi:hypothetical protein